MAGSSRHRGVFLAAALMVVAATSLVPGVASASGGGGCGGPVTDEAGTRAIAQKKFPGIKPEVLNPALDRYLPHFSKDGVLTAETIQSAQEVLKAAGLIQTILPYQEIVVQLR